MIATDAAALADDPPPIAVTGLRPEEDVQLRYQLVDQFRRTWSTTVSARTDESGSIDLSHGLPDTRWVNGRDPFAGLWSMRCTTDPTARFSDSLAGDIDPLTVTLHVDRNEGSGLSGKFLRRFLAPNVDYERIRQPEVVGDLFVPHSPRSQGATLVLGGAWGWFSWSREAAALIASRGRTAMAIAYFDWGAREGLARALSEVPLERFEAALNVLGTHSAIDPSDLAVVGVSKGAEAALLLASRSSDVTKVVALSTSSHVWESVRVDRRAEASSWSKAGSPIAYLRFDASEEFYRTLDKRLLLSRHNAALDTEAAAAAAIPVEQIRADTLLVSLDNDVVWPSRRMADIVHRRMSTAGLARVRHLVLDAAGHALFAPGTPANAIDGDPLAAAVADYRAWQAMLQHLGLKYDINGPRRATTWNEVSR